MGLSHKPQWIMVGCDGPTEALPCRLIASAKLTYAELVIKIDYGPFFWDVGLYAGPTGREATLSVRMDPEGLVIIDGADWQTCLAELSRIWAPGTGKITTLAITMGQKQVGDGT